MAARSAVGSAAKDRAKACDQYACVLCGWDTIVHAHHIEHKSKGGSDEIENLITLCPNHHAMAHAGMISVEDLKALAKDRSYTPKTERRPRSVMNYRLQH